MDLASTRISFSRLSKFFAVDNAMPISINRKYAVDNVSSSKLVTLEAVSRLRAASFELQLSRIPSTACDKHHARLGPEPSTTSNLIQDKCISYCFLNYLFNNYLAFVEPSTTLCPAHFWGIPALPVLAIEEKQAERRNICDNY